MVDTAETGGLGPYRMLFTVGKGGMGVVDVALEMHRGRTGRVVALKRLLPEVARDQRHTRMFLREARLASLLEHPNVVHALDYGELDGQFYLAMEYVEGESLSRVVKTAREQGGLPPDIVAYVLAHIADGLHAAHELRDEDGARLNFVHRDVSPANMIIGYDGAIKLLDFGVAKVDEGQVLTRTGEVKGNCAYMSPEQAMGDALDRRSDLYSLGACLYECIAGRPMWTGSDMEVLRQLAIGRPPDLEERVPGTPRELAALHRRLVAHEPDGRPQTAADVADALREFVERSAGRSRADAESLRRLMGRMFAERAAQKRLELESALQMFASPPPPPPPPPPPTPHVPPLRGARPAPLAAPVPLRAPVWHAAPAAPTAPSVPAAPSANGPWTLALVMAVVAIVLGSAAWLTRDRPPPSPVVAPAGT